MKNLKTETRKELVAMKEFDIDTAKAIEMLDAGKFDSEFDDFSNMRVSEVADYLFQRSHA